LIPDSLTAEPEQKNQCRERKKHFQYWLSVTHIFSGLLSPLLDGAPTSSQLYSLSGEQFALGWQQVIRRPRKAVVAHSQEVTVQGLTVLSPRARKLLWQVLHTCAKLQCSCVARLSLDSWNYIFNLLPPLPLLLWSLRKAFTQQINFTWILVSGSASRNPTETEEICFQMLFEFHSFCGSQSVWLSLTCIYNVVSWYFWQSDTLRNSLRP
jgi:hypothetical protein